MGRVGPPVRRLRPAECGGDRARRRCVHDGAVGQEEARRPAPHVRAITIAGGAVLYWRDWDAAGSFGDWVGSRFGGVLTVGAVAAIAAFLIGLLGTRPDVQRLLALGREIASAEGPPAPELAAELQRLQARLKVLGRTILALITIAVLAMATARYW